MTGRDSVVGGAFTFPLLADGELKMADGSPGGDSTESGGGSDPGTSDSGKVDKGLGNRATDAG
jgi:hypothetical protein